MAPCQSLTLLPLFKPCPFSRSWVPDAVLLIPQALEVRVMYSYTATQPGDLSMNEGDKLVVLEQAEANWWKARDGQGRVGYIPSNYVRPCGIESEP